MFNFTHQFVQPGCASTGDGAPECRRCFAKWIVDACTVFDASQGLQGPLVLRTDQVDTVNNLNLFLDRAQIPKRVRTEISQDIVAFGAVAVEELSQEDWEDLPSWGLLKVAERRRVLTCVLPTPA